MIQITFAINSASPSYYNDKRYIFLIIEKQKNLKNKKIKRKLVDEMFLV